MKKLYRKGKVHPSPPLVSNQLAFLPTAILTLTTLLSPEDRQVLAYLISCGGGGGSSGNFPGGRKNTVKGGEGEHPPLFHCDCFRCYTSFWARWDSSPNRELIHEIIDAFEDGLLRIRTKNVKNRKERRKGGVCNGGSGEMKLFEEGIGRSNELSESESVEVTGNIDGGGGEGGGDDGDEGLEKGSVTKFLNFIGERIWGSWNSSLGLS